MPIIEAMLLRIAVAANKAGALGVFDLDVLVSLISIQTKHHSSTIG